MIVGPVAVLARATSGMRLRSGNTPATETSVNNAPVTRTAEEQAAFDAQQDAARKSAAAAQAERDARVAQAGEKAEG